MSENPAPLFITVQGDWWYFAGMIAALSGIPPASGIIHQGDIITIETAIGKATMDMTRDPLRIVFVPKPGQANACSQVIATVKVAAETARTLRREIAGMTPYEAIELYYRARAAGGHATLRDVAEQYHLSYTALRKHKQNYDREGRWGSKPNSVSDTHTNSDE